ncbi:MAG TPA: head GIN domain-containing protein [Solirubrobacter sp.]|nr:head GIN domain-containing protein [Solirubrobacter sp.]
MRAAPLIPVALGALLVGGCGLRDDGPRTTQTRDLAAFTRIHNRASVDVRLRVGAPQTLRVVAGENVIDDVATEVSDGTLEIRFDNDGWGESDVAIEATVPSLAGIESSGSGEIDVDGVTGDAFHVRSDGSAEIDVDGAVARVALELNGSGNADLAGLAARFASVRVRGSGDADVRADQRLQIDVDGSGDVRYYGQPELSQHVDGSGDVSQAS